MCGIAGFIDKNPNYDVDEIATLIGNEISHRGPDSFGGWHDSNYGVNLIHRRLAILDLSPAGFQPMLSESKRFVIVFNGEIYNFKQIKVIIESKCGQIIWRSNGDTEVILKAMEIYGFEGMLNMLEGMFAIAIWDRDKSMLHLARDRIGEKPLYYGYFNGVFGFASELKALRKHPCFNLEINRDALGQFMLNSAVPAPLSIFDGVNKLLPGHYISCTIGEILSSKKLESKAYWKLPNFEKNSLLINDAQVIETLDSLLTRVISDQMVADVPVGCFLSGGVDSSLIAALMQKQSSSPIHTFSIGFNDDSYNEAHFALEVAKHIGSNHHELYITAQDALSVIPQIASIYDEPFADPSQLPTYLVSKLARNEVIVALSGDGGDELFAGYNRYLFSEKIYKQIARYPQRLRNIIAKLLPLNSSRVLGVIGKFANLPITNLSDRLYKLESSLKVQSFEEFYTVLTGKCLNFDKLVLGNNIKDSLWSSRKHNMNNALDHMQYLDVLGYLPDDILVKVDRAAMANSLETRVPLLNHKIVEFSNGLSSHYKIRNGVTKWCLREVLYQYVPRNLIERPKSGFAIPLNSWLRVELKDWAIELLNPTKLRDQGFLDVKLVMGKLNDHLTGKSNNGFYLWNILMFQSWFDSL